MTVRPWLLLLAPLLFLVNCAPSTPAGRIEKNPKIYNDLSVAEQELVSRGNIAEGMEPGGVFLALGAPEQQLEGFSDGTRTMRWDYTALTPIYTNSFYGGFGHGGFGRGFGRRGGFGRHGGFGGRGFGRGFNSFGVGNSIDYIPTRSNTVWFENGKVRSWERLR